MDILEYHFTHNGNTKDHVCYKTFYRLFEELEKRGFPPLTILETGVSSAGVKSTHLFDAYVTRFGGTFLTVDSNAKLVNEVRPTLGPRTYIEVNDSVEFLTDWVASNPNVQADLVYLDSFDLEWMDPGPSASHGLAEYLAILPALKPGSLLLIDDTPTKSEEFQIKEPMYSNLLMEGEKASGIKPGKGTYIQEQIKAECLAHWYQILYRF